MDDEMRTMGGRVVCGVLLASMVACGGFEGDDGAESFDEAFVTDEAALDSFRRPTDQGPIQLLVPKTGSLARDAGFHRYTFEGTAGWELRFTETSASFKTHLRVIAPNGRQWNVVGRRPPGGAYVSELALRLPRTGTYKVIATSTLNVSSSSRRSRGAYTLSVEGNVFCGGIAAFQCPSHLVCELDGTYPDAGGHCAIPTRCDQLDVAACASNPKCEIYASGCENNVCTNPEEGGCHPCDPVAACREKQVGAEGARCGTRGTLPCGDGLFCNHPLGAQCGVFDAPGQCAVIPDACTREYMPVCGCDGVTYGNRCEAAHVGVSVKAERACP